jgi:hypothetical protein
LTLAANQAIDAEPLHPVGAGLLGAGMAVIFMLILFLLTFLFGLVRCGKKVKRTKISSSDVSGFFHHEIIEMFIVFCRPDRMKSRSRFLKGEPRLAHKLIRWKGVLIYYEVDTLYVCPAVKS